MHLFAFVSHFFAFVFFNIFFAFFIAFFSHFSSYLFCIYFAFFLHNRIFLHLFCVCFFHRNFFLHFICVCFSHRIFFCIFCFSFFLVAFFLHFCIFCISFFAFLFGILVFFMSHFRVVLALFAGFFDPIFLHVLFACFLITYYLLFLACPFEFFNRISSICFAFLLVLLRILMDNCIAGPFENRMSCETLHVSINWFQIVLGLARKTRKSERPERKKRNKNLWLISFCLKARREQKNMTMCLKVCLHVRSFFLFPAPFLCGI